MTLNSYDRILNELGINLDVVISAPDGYEAKTLICINPNGESVFVEKK